MREKSISLRQFVADNSRVVQTKDLDADAGFVFADDRMLEIKEKIVRNGVRLGDLDGVEIRTGLQTGLNVAFIIDRETASKMYKNLNCRQFLYKASIGKNIRRFYLKETSQYVIYIPKGWTNTNIPGVDKESKMKAYIPEIMDHLIQWSYTQSKGSGLYDRSMGDYWWEVMSNYNYKQPKIIWQMISEQFRAFYDTDGTLCNIQGTFSLVSNKSSEICAILNTEIVDKLYTKVYTRNTLGNKGSQRTKGSVENIVIPYNIEVLRGYTNKIQSLKQQNLPTDQLEAEVEKIVQKLYGLTDEEVAYLCKE